MNKIHYNETLYAISKKGKVKTWTCQVKVENGKVMLITYNQTGDTAKPISRSQEITEGKNIDKANETTALQQALSEATSRLTKKLKEGYKTKRPSLSAQANTNALGFLQPMLAKPLDTNAKNIVWPALIQPKLDGHRALVTKTDKGEIVMYSRKGTIISSMSHILSEITHLPKGCYLDGELYAHGNYLQDIASVIKKYKKGASEKIKYILYDCIIPNDTGYLSRSTWLFKHFDKKKNIEIIDTLPVQTVDGAKAISQKYITSGFEGGIIRNMDMKYEPGVRSNQLTKVKFFDESEFEIINVEEQEGLGINGHNIVLSVIVCKTTAGLEFRVSAPGTFEAKEDFLKNKKDYIGKQLTIKHSGYTKDMKPIHPVALRVRDDI